MDTGCSCHSGATSTFSPATSDVFESIPGDAVPDKVHHKLSMPQSKPLLNGQLEAILWATLAELATWAPRARKQ
ncbi:hypothetical protein LA080_010031 [Diaporthe eres]|nr:hypothetical protein LA080_010031 [Diaporthe eres]